MGANLHGRVNDRKKRRMPCKVTVGQTHHNGLLIDLSHSGLFIQTLARANLGDKIELRFNDAEGSEIELGVEVVRRKVVPPRLLSVAQGGIGVRVLEAPDEYFDFLRELGVPDDAPWKSDGLQRFSILMKEQAGTRSKRVELEAEDEESAIRIALESLGEDWKVQNVEALD